MESMQLWPVLNAEGFSSSLSQLDTTDGACELAIGGVAVTLPDLPRRSSLWRTDGRRDGGGGQGNKGRRRRRGRRRWWWRRGGRRRWGRRRGRRRRRRSRRQRRGRRRAEGWEARGGLGGDQWS